MKLTNLPSEFQEALPILEKIKAEGFEAYFVGGSVRDALLNRPIHDVDIASSSYPEETKQIFERTVDVGIEHGTVLVLENEGEYEVTTFRTEDVYVDYRRPSQVTFVRSLEEDLKRRDFTINAFALNEGGEIVDLFDGLKDLDARLLRAVGQATERFNEDALRIMRGFRFQASLDFDLEASTAQAMRDCAPLLEKISVERIFIEFDKLLLAPAWKRGLLSLAHAKASDFLPEMKDQSQALVKLTERLKGDFQFQSSEQAWTALFLELGIDQVKGFLKKWKTSNDFQKKVQAMVEVAQIREERVLNRREVYAYDLDVILQVENLRRGRGQDTQSTAVTELYESLPIHDKQEVAINGGILIQEYGFKPGPELGAILNQVEYAIVDGILRNEREAIMEYIRKQNNE